MAKYRLSREELNAQLDEQLDLLSASSERFDAGHVAEAKHMALRVRVLLHKTSKSKPLLDIVGVKHRLLYVDTAGPIELNVTLEPRGQARPDHARLGLSSRGACDGA